MTLKSKKPEGFDCFPDEFVDFVSIHQCTNMDAYVLSCVRCFNGESLELCITGKSIAAAIKKMWPKGGPK